MKYLSKARDSFATLVLLKFRSLQCNQKRLPSIEHLDIRLYNSED